MIEYVNSDSDFSKQQHSSVFFLWGLRALFETFIIVEKYGNILPESSIVV
jgi:hypothetical protein